MRFISEEALKVSVESLLLLLIEIIREHYLCITWVFWTLNSKV